ncbi:ATP-grasp domain-containing protein [Citricoccus sp. NR2]|uniref:ATP-grasp domain-containing protein n=1 Tax=Citricoccus sp. NR2 TaxID=3004095 RepID=UPI0022DE0D54|nr:ATP-grasp domain-containing protein [Citricoccus sp. NR2]WBL19768.1 ATP-grasp domain-containing protein [Citricoccus sp. NR2]
MEPKEPLIASSNGNGTSSHGDLALNLSGAKEMIFAGHGVGASLFAHAAQQHSNAEIHWIAEGQGVATVNGDDYMIDGPVLNESSLGAAIITNKGMTKQFLEAAGLNTPRGFAVYTEDEAVEKATEIQAPVVVKPNGGSKGNGVTVDIQGDAEIREAFRYATAAGKLPVLLEEYIDFDTEYRCLATAEECVAVIHRVLPKVTGDGKSTIKQLIDQKNESRRNNPGLRYLPIPIDNIVDTVLGRQGYSLDSTLEQNKEIIVRNVGGLSGGGEPHEVSPLVSDELKSLARETVANIPGLRWGAVDIVTEKVTGKPYVIEVNCRAHYAGATFPFTGEPKDIASPQWLTRVSLFESDSTTPHLELSSTERSSQKTLSRQVRLSRLFFDWLDSQGYEVDDTQRTLIKVSRDNHDQWFTGQMLGPSDLLASTSMFRRHGYIRAFLALKKIFRVRGGYIRSEDALRRRLNNSPSPLLAVKSSNGWRNASSKLITTAEDCDIFHEHPRWYVQSYPQGPRVTILSSRNTSFAMFSKETLSQLAPSNMDDASRLALHAVRAIPQLRWAAADLVYHQSGNRGHWRVEGLSLNPSFTSNMRLVAGSASSFFEYLIKE